MPTPISISSSPRSNSGDPLAGGVHDVSAIPIVRVTELTRSSSGSLAYRGCVGDRGPADCRPLPRGTLAGAAGIAVAPGGRDLFVASQVGTVTHFKVTAGGRLAFAGCIGDGGLAGCEPAPGHLLAGANQNLLANQFRGLKPASRLGAGLNSGSS